MQQPERVLVVGVQLAGVSPGAAESSLDELAALAESAGGQVVGRMLQRRERPDPALFIGKGKAVEIADASSHLHVDLVVFDEDLSPAQQRNLDDAIPGRVLDRTSLILDIFAQRAMSREGKTQVELAQLTYLLPRLRGWGTQLSRIGGSGGGRSPIGTRGPGETKLEVDRRRIEGRLHKLRGELAVLHRRRALGRRQRSERVPTVSLVGYTNAGKSTVLNLLTGAGVSAQNRLFDTLDPTARRVKIPGSRTIVLSDTVGFIRKLPHGLVEAFKSTLEEVADADVLIHVVDASHSDPDADVAAVEEVLAEIGATHSPRVVALNKVDLLEPEQRLFLQRRFPTAVQISAFRGEGIDELLAAVTRQLDMRVVEADAVVPHEQSALVARLHAQGRVVRAEYEADGIRVRVRGSSDELASLEQWLVAE